MCLLRVVTYAVVKIYSKAEFSNIYKCDWHRLTEGSEILRSFISFFKFGAS